MVSKADKNEARLRRHKRVRGKINGTPERPRLDVFRSNMHIYAQIIDDVNGVTQMCIRDRQWTHGGIVFAPKPRDYTVTLNKKVKRLAMKSALSSKVQDNEMIVVDAITTEGYKTKKIAEMLKARCV